MRMYKLVVMALAALALSLAIACENETPATPAAEQTISTRAPGEAEYLTHDILPCTQLPGSEIEPCDPNASVYWGQQAGGVGTRGPLGDSPLPMSHFFDGSISYRPSIVLRGTFLPGTVRCITGIANREPGYVESGGLFEDSLVMECYADVRVNSYIVGSGPTKLALMVSYFHYFEGDFKDFLGPDTTTAKEGLSFMRVLLEDSLVNGSSPGQTGPLGREAILFIGPSHNHETEKWEVFGVWEMEVRDDGTVIAVHPNRDLWKHDATEFETHRSKLEMTLEDFTAAARAAHQALVTANGGRIAPADIDGLKPNATLPMIETNANRITQFYTNAGAYQHPDGPPKTPEPAYACAGGSAVSSGRENVMLIQHCEALLDGKDILRGTASLNWSKTVAMTAWDGITTATVGDIVLKRLTKVEPPNKSLSGSIPAEFGNLLWLTHLDLSGNSLTGEIPAALSNLTRLQVLKLSGNSLTGCIPVMLKDVATNDLASLNLPYCQPPAPGSLRLGTVGETSVGLSWDAVSGASKYRVLQAAKYDLNWTIGDDDITATSHTVERLKCGTEHDFRVSAYGSGTTYAAAWGGWSPVTSAPTTACVTPVFAEKSYSFMVAENSATGTAVGTVSATDPNGDILSYSITGGDPDDAFVIDSATGAITVSGSLDHETTASYELTVQATDGTNTAEVEVSITVTDVNEPPGFDSPSYGFSVVIDAAVGAEVGRVSATDDSGDPVTYAVTAGNEAGLFALDESSGAITVAGDLSGQAGTTVTLTVEASDGTTTTTAAVEITIAG